MAKNLSHEQIEAILAVGRDAQKLFEAGVDNAVELMDDGTPVLMVEPILRAEAKTVYSRLEAQSNQAV